MMLPPIGFLGSATNIYTVTTAHRRTERRVSNTRKHNGSDGCGCFVVVCVSDRSTIDLRHHLIRDDDSHSKLVCDAQQCSQELRQVHLACRQLPTPRVIRAIQGCRAVHNHQRVATLGEHGRRLDQQLGLVIGVVGASVGDVVQHIRRIQTEPGTNKNKSGEWVALLLALPLPRFCCVVT